MLAQDILGSFTIGNEDSDEEVSDDLIYIACKSPPGVRNRDFSHRRMCHQAEGKYTIVDVSVEDDRAVLKPKFIRAHTLFSGAYLEADEHDGKSIVKYDTITLLDVRGDLPKPVINALAARATVKWFKSMCQACESHENGKL
jgi:START domain